MRVGKLLVPVVFSGVIAASCLPARGGVRYDPYFSEWQRIEALRYIADSVRAQSGAYPPTLNDVCRQADEEEWLCDDSATPRLTDGWGHPLWYESTADDYLIGSPGPDGARGTVDDLGIDSETEADRVRALSGCYLVGETPPGNGEERLLVLDTARVHLLRSEWAAWAPSDSGFSSPKWHPWRQDSVLVSWAVVRRRVNMRLAPSGDSLVGVVESAQVTSWWGRPVPFSVVAVRGDCGK